MSLEQKCKLYFMIYNKLVATVGVHSRGNGKANLPLSLHQEAFKRTNYILATVGEKLEWDEILA